MFSLAREPCAAPILYALSTDHVERGAQRLCPGRVWHQAAPAPHRRLAHQTGEHMTRCRPGTGDDDGWGGRRRGSDVKCHAGLTGFGVG